MNQTTLAYLLLGSNLGDRATLLREACAELAATAGELMAVSGIYETAAWGREDQPAFLNQAVVLRTAQAPEALLAACLAVERHAGRERRERWGSRTLDVDMLLYGLKIISSPILTVPHPQLAVRRFALMPLAEIAAPVRVPGLGATVAELLAQCPDPLLVKHWEG